MPQIAISEQNYRRLQAFARPFEDTVDDVLERLLHSAEANPPPGPAADRLPQPPSELITSHGPLPNGIQLRAIYKGRIYSAEIVNGSVVFQGTGYPSLSRAAVAVLHSTGSKRPTENGWRFWQYYDPERNNWFSAEGLKDGAVVEGMRGLPSDSISSSNLT